MEVVSLKTLLEFSLLVVLVDLPRKIWNVNSSITFSGDEQLVILILWVFDIELLESGKGILRLRHIIMVQCFLGSGNGVTNTSWGLNVENVGSLIPWMWVLIDGTIVINNNWTILLEETKKG